MKKNLRTLYHKKPTEAIFERDDEYCYDIRPKNGCSHPSSSIEQLCEQSRKIREEQDKLTPLEIARQRTEASLKRLKEVAHYSSPYPKPVKTETDDG